MGQNQTNEVIERLILYWQFHRHFNANITELANYTRVSRDTVYRWLNRKAQPKEQKLKLIQEWLVKRATEE
jgi:predicted DNA-binding transcriptional regulator AlpA